MCLISALSSFCDATMQSLVGKLTASMDSRKSEPRIGIMSDIHLDGLDLTQVRLLAELVEARNLSTAAARIGLSQSAASHAFAKLRLIVGDPLFVRDGSSIQLTPYGERLSTAAREALEKLVDGLVSNRPFDPQATTRRFSIYLNDVGQLVLLPKLVALMKEQAPNASLRVCHIPPERPGLALASGEVDLAAGLFTNLTTGFHQALLYAGRYVCVVRSNHPRFRAGMTLPAFLASEHALADPSGMAHMSLERALVEHNVRRIIRLSVPEFMVLPLVIAESDLVAIMPSGLAKAFSSYVGLQILPPPIPLPEYDLKAYWHERYHRDPAHRWFRRALVKLLRK